MFPPLSARSSGAADAKRKPLGADAAAAPQAEQVSEWTPHDVAEWLYLLGTKDDYAHTFLVHSIDGPALLGLTREQLVDWKVRAADCNTILKGIQELDRRQMAAGGYRPAPLQSLASDPAVEPSPRTKRTAAASKPGGSNKAGTGAPAPAVADPRSAIDGAMALSLARGTKVSTGEQTMKQSQGSYLRSVMGELHSNERVPLWKEEMVERVKRRSTVARERTQRDMAAARRPTPPMEGHGRSRHGRSSRSLASEGQQSMKADSIGEGGVNSKQAREIERRLFWYQDAIHEHELQRQLLEQRFREVQQQLDESQQDRDSNLRSRPDLAAVGAVGAEREHHKRLERERTRVARAMQVSEQRVSAAERVNKELMSLINKLRHGRSEFLAQMHKLAQREQAMQSDMKHFAQAAHASLDEKEKLEARVKRQQFDYKVEGQHYENVLNGLSDDLSALDVRIAEAHVAEEDTMQQERQSTYRGLKSRRDVEQTRELRVGYLQNQVRGQELDFQRLYRIINVRFTPEKPESVLEIISASLRNEERNASLLAYVGVQTAQVDSLEEDQRRLDAEAEELVALRQKEMDERLEARRSARRHELISEATASAISAHDKVLQQLCPLVEKLFAMLECAVPDDDGGLFALKGCRPDTLGDHLRELDGAIKELRVRALAKGPKAKGADDEDEEEEAAADGVIEVANEVLRQFVAPRELEDYPTVIQLRKEIESAAQKHSQKGLSGDDLSPPGTAALPFGDGP